MVKYTVQKSNYKTSKSLLLLKELKKIINSESGTIELKIKLIKKAIKGYKIMTAGINLVKI